MFADILNDKITLVSKDGMFLKESIPAFVNSGKVIIQDSSLPIASGDRILRTLPSELVEEYIVVDPGFIAGSLGLEAYYQVKVRRSDSPPAEPQTIINNIQGQNARVNINSTDNSNNLAFSNDERKIFQELRDLIAKSDIPADQTVSIKAAVLGMEQATSKESFKAKYVEFMGLAANHIAVFGPVLGCLAGLL